MASMSACFLIISPKSHHSVLSPVSVNPSQLKYFLPPRSPIISERTICRSHRIFVSSIKASGAESSSVDVSTSAVRPGGSVESDKLPTDVRKRAMDAIDASGRRVTIGDVASNAGLKLNEAQKTLQALAADTNGFLEVFFELCPFCSSLLKLL